MPLLQQVPGSLGDPSPLEASQHPVLRAEEVRVRVAPALVIQWFFPQKIVIFHCYIKLPKGNTYIICINMCGHCIEYILHDKHLRYVWYCHVWYLSIYMCIYIYTCTPNIIYIYLYLQLQGQVRDYVYIYIDWFILKNVPFSPNLISYVL